MNVEDETSVGTIIDKDKGAFINMRDLERVLLLDLTRTVSPEITDYILGLRKRLNSIREEVESE